MFFCADSYNLTSSFHSVCCLERVTAFWQIKCRFIIGHMWDTSSESVSTTDIWSHALHYHVYVLNGVSSELMILRCAKAKPVTPKMPYSFQKFTAVTVRENTVSYNCTGSRLCVTKQKTLSNIIQWKSDHSAPLYTDYQGSQNNKSWLMPYTCCYYRNHQYGNG